MPTSFGFPSTPISLNKIRFLHGFTRATMDMTFARGPAVAAARGIAVEAIHQSLNIHQRMTEKRRGRRDITEAHHHQEFSFESFPRIVSISRPISIVLEFPGYLVWDSGPQLTQTRYSPSFCG